METFRVLLPTLVTLLFLSASVDGYGGGAPPKACESMTPGHMYNATTPILPQEGDSPYSLEVDEDMVKQGQKVKVTVKGPVFEGFLIQARLSDDSSTTPVGTFTDIDEYFTEYRECTSVNDAITHESPRPKGNGTFFTWMAPSEPFGDVYILATVAANHSNFWVGIKSSVIEYDAGPTTPTSEPEATTQAGRTTPTPEPDATTQAATWIVPSLSSIVVLLFVAIFLKL